MAWGSAASFASSGPFQRALLKPLHRFGISQNAGRAHTERLSLPFLPSRAESLSQRFDKTFKSAPQEMTDAEVNDAKAYLLQASSKSGINL